MSTQPEVVQDTAAAVVVPAAGLTTLAVIKNPRAAKYLFFQFDVITQALDDFDVVGVGHSAAGAADFTPANWAVPASVPNAVRVKESSGNLAAQAAATSGWFGMDITGLSEITVKVSAAVNNATVTPRWTLT